MRAAGLASSRNPLLIFVPCHRVIPVNGRMRGYTAGLPVRRWLLARESTLIFERSGS